LINDIGALIGIESQRIQLECVEKNAHERVGGHGTVHQMPTMEKKKKKILCQERIQRGYI
jgi:hypothetical protein